MQLKKDYFLDFIWLSFFAYLNYAQPLFADDWYRGHIAALYNGTILDNLIHDYMTWTGRMSAQLLVYPFLNAPWEEVCNFVFGVLNTLVLWGICRLGYSLTVKEKNSYNYFFFSVFFCAFLYLSGFLRNSLWLTGGIQYTWGIFFLLFFVYGYRVKSIFVNPFSLFLLGIFNGFYNEIFFAFAFFVPIAYAVFCFLAQQKLDYVRGVSSFWIANLLSGLISIMAPGNYLRKAFEEKEMRDTSFVYRLTHLFEELFTQRHALFFLSLIAFLLFSLFFHLKKNKLSPRSQKALLIFALGILGGTFALFVPVGHLNLEERMLMLPQFIAFLLSFYFFNLYFISFFQKKYMQMSFAVLMFFFMIWHVAAYSHLDQFQQNRLGLMKTTHQLPIYQAPFWAPKVVSFMDIREDENQWANRVFSDYFGLEKAVGITKKI